MREGRRTEGEEEDLEVLRLIEGFALRSGPDGDFFDPLIFRDTAKEEILKGNGGLGGELLEEVGEGGGLAHGEGEDARGIALRAEGEGEGGEAKKERDREGGENEGEGGGPVVADVEGDGAHGGIEEA